ncbi:MAG: DUF2279 domain-containing protein [Candidatus Kapabacteria bacterium]|nr:DUF2279 domain-containing protein [Candidatus Kapabacteria bacterium]
MIATCRLLILAALLGWQAPLPAVSFLYPVPCEPRSEADSLAGVVAGSAPPDAPGIDGWRLGAISTVGIGAFAIGHGWLNNLWWKGAPADFHVNWQQDWTYALGADKLGHAYFTSMASKVIAGSLRWSGVDTLTALWTGSAVALTYQTYNEIRDGYSVNYGFSPGDVAANVIGAALPVLQHYVPALRNVTFQISFYASEPFRSGMYNAIIDDYESTTHWLSFDVYEMLPAEAQAWYPSYLNIALGHSVRGLVGPGPREHVLVLSLDWNVKRLPCLPNWLRSAFEWLHMYHLPAPAVEIYPQVAWFGLRF